MEMEMKMDKEDAKEKEEAEAEEMGRESEKAKAIEKEEEEEAMVKENEQEKVAPLAMAVGVGLGFAAFAPPPPLPPVCRCGGVAGAPHSRSAASTLRRTAWFDQNPFFAACARTWGGRAAMPTQHSERHVLSPCFAACAPLIWGRSAMLTQHRQRHVLSQLPEPLLRRARPHQRGGLVGAVHLWRTAAQPSESRRCGQRLRRHSCVL